MDNIVKIDEYELEKLKKKAQKYDDDVQTTNMVIKFIVLGVIVFVAIIAFFMWAIPQYSIWSAEKHGRAQLAEAEYSKQVQVKEAESNKEAEKLNAEAEVERAKGAAEARQTEGLGMTPEQYIQYLWVKKLSLAESKIIYLPTENGIPTLTQEADK